MNRLQRLIYNEGERLVPHVSHDEGELVRHRSSYAFFHAVIAADIASGRAREGQEVSIVDLGFGSGYGCALLSSLAGACITGVDIAPECEVFARQYYPRSNVDYVIEDLARYVPEMAPFDYAVSRGVLEHVPDGVRLVEKIKFRRRVMVDVPYDEGAGNQHHVLTGIKEEAFAHLPDCELFYEDIEGRIYDAARRPDRPNMIMVVRSAPGLPRVGALLEFPLEPVRDDGLEVAGRRNAVGRLQYFETPEELLMAAEKAVREVDVVMDIGCGIAPMSYFRPRLHFLVEPWKEYAEILSYRFAGDKSAIVLRAGALEALEQFGDNSVDSIFMLDVIEHLEKGEGRQVLRECERVAREQVVVFTPLGFMPQHVEAGEADGWGLGGGAVQAHRSGWAPEDFSNAWSFYVCKDFHRVSFKGEALERPYGAFFAIRSFEGKAVAVPDSIPDLRRPLPAEVTARRLEAECQRLRAECQQEREARAALQAAYQELLRSRALRLARMVRRVLGMDTRARRG